MLFPPLLASHIYSCFMIYSARKVITTAQDQPSSVQCIIPYICNVHGLYPLFRVTLSREITHVCSYWNIVFSMYGYLHEYVCIFGVCVWPLICLPWLLLFIFCVSLFFYLKPYEVSWWCLCVCIYAVWECVHVLCVFFLRVEGACSNQK